MQYSIEHHPDSNILELQNSDKSFNAKIYLDAGASLQELTLDNKKIITDLHPLDYANMYTSSILFPFANRIKDGKYTFNDEVYQFEINQKEENNALHGLVFNKTFNVVSQNITDAAVALKLEYVEKENSIGFPYSYIIQVEYIFTKDTLRLNILIKNTDEKPFPFTLGWHPYFLSQNLYNSSVDFDSNQKLTLSDRNITTGIEVFEESKKFPVLDKFLDDCFLLNSNEVIFNTPEYNFSLSSTEEDSFLQLYTPNFKNAIAIEPTTGVSDSFNNEIGLKELQPNEDYNISWELKLLS